MNTDRHKSKALTLGDNPEWVEGFYSQFKDGSVYVFPPDGMHSFDNYEIDPSTLCQCTGLKDSQSKLGFEGDLFKDMGGNTYIIRWASNGWFSQLESNGRVMTPLSGDALADMTLTGKNIHDPKQTEK